MILGYDRPIDKQMLQIFTAAQASLLDELYFAIQNGKDYAYLTTRINSINQELQTNYYKYSTASIQEHYIDGATPYDKKLEADIKEIQNLPIEERMAAWARVVGEIGGVNVAVVESLITQSNEYVAQTMNNINKWILGTFSQAKIKDVFENIWTSETLGKWVFESRVALEEYFQSTWAGYFVDRAGRKRTLSRYSEMLIRTEISKAQNTSTLVRWKELWITKYKRIEHMDACPICVPHRNEIVDIKDGMPYIILHPNCRWYRDPIFN